MSLPTDPAAPELPLSPRRVLMESPLAVAGWIRSRRLQREGSVTMRGQRWIALFGTLLMHMVFLAIFVLGPPYDWQPPQREPEQYLQVRLIDADELPPPPPAPGALPKQLGPRHQGLAATAAATTPSRTPGAGRTARPERSAAASAPLAPARPSPQAAPVRRPVAAPLPSVSLPTPAPMPQLQPVPLAGQPPSVALAMPSLQPPAPPKFQPHPVRPVRDEGQQPVLPPPSLALPEVPAATLPPVMTPSIALRVEPPRMDTPASVSALRAQVPAAPPVPDMQPVPLPAQLAPTVELQAPLSVPAPVAARDVPRVQAPALKVAEAQLQAVPVPAVDAVRVSTRPAAVKITVPDATVEQRTPAITQVVAPPAAPPTAAVPALPPPTPLPPPVAVPTPVPATAPATHETAQVERPTSAPAATEPDVSTAPDATPQGRDDAVLGPPAATATSTPGAATGAASARAAGAPLAQATGDHEQGPGKLAGQTGGKQPGAAQGERSGAPGDYIQLKPRGDTEVMHRSTPNIGYKPTRFEGEWTPYGESSIDTALRRAVEKTTVEHTFHLPRGIRVKCAVKPLLPIALFGCANPDPPPAPVASKVYDRLHLAPANPVAAPTPVADIAPAPAPTLKLDNAAECAVARLSGGPPPPDCADTTSPVAPVRAPASTSSSWVPASDQFH
jgi:hypothetical protein